MRDYNRMHNALRLEEDNKNVIAQVVQEVGTDKDHIEKNFDKIHPIVDLKDEKQTRILKFTTRSFKERILIQHRQRKKSEKKKINKNLRSTSTSNPY